MMKTLYDKLWEEHHVTKLNSGESLLYIDRHYLHEVTSPQAFEGLSKKKLKPWRLDANIATPDHNVPTIRGKNFNSENIKDEISKIQVVELDKNCNLFGIKQFDIKSTKQGIVHVIGPELGYTLPGMTIVCGDSHTSTHGALGCLAMGIGTSEVEHVLATQCLKVSKLKNMLVRFEGITADNVSSKDIVLYFIGLIGTAGGTGYAIEFAGSYIENISIESRMTICNMAIEAGAKVGLIAPDKTTIEYVREKSFLDDKTLQNAEDYWENLKTDKGASFDKEVVIDVSKIKPQVTWGTSPEMVVNFDDEIPTISQTSIDNQKNIELARDYMGINEASKLSDLVFDKVFIGSCTNSRIEDLRTAAEIVKGKTIANNISEAIVVPGSGLVKEQAEKEGLDKVFIEAGFIWRDPGCSMCLGMNPDQLKPYERCASTSNRNFEGRQGYLGRTHLMSPLMAAYTAINGTIGEPS
ncbi:MAG: 3-isopropylmalate dehydratase large subunit [SAR86 cluster bacterium]|uniref:3-isopropylmalate dehydratase large subunit n=1 Tax=SAR86 cluster bacterium TaxID=2030880 RepID=A0A520MXN3_9GAMM|nr:MAG: 3-isopropylmalate dehydratase large subunit [SAR86 cluster bacterium]